MNDLYSILGVGPEASNMAIKAAYRALAKQSHPDLHLGDDAAESRTKDINQAYTILGDPESRAAYDGGLTLLAAKRRKVFFVNTSAIAAGIAALVIAGAAVTMTVASWHGGHPSRIAMVGVPESVVANSSTAVPEAQHDADAASAPAAAPDVAPARETEHAALVIVRQPETGAAAPVARARHVTAAANAGSRLGERRDVYRERRAIKKPSRKSGERTKPLRTASFVPPRLAEDSEPWPAPRGTMALRWGSADEPFGGTR